jgi:hypothetical protein
MPRKNKDSVSSGHKLGQLIGDWFEKFFVLPLLIEVSDKLQLNLNNRFVKIPGRPNRLKWKDENNNTVDYDFVLELDGTLTQIGAPVAFIESCWRRGSRHSKDKARDDSGKLLPMRSSYPTARFLGLVVAGDFTEPARDLVISSQIDLFYVPKDKIINAFLTNGLTIDYPDDSEEVDKQLIAMAFESAYTEKLAKNVSNTLKRLIGKAAVTSYVDRVRASLSALPQEIRIILRNESSPIVFKSVSEATTFLKNPVFKQGVGKESYIYQITYSDGTEFERTASDIDKLRALHEQTIMLTNHVNKLAGLP